MSVSFDCGCTVVRVIETAVCPLILTLNGTDRGRKLLLWKDLLFQKTTSCAQWFFLTRTECKEVVRCAMDSQLLLEILSRESFLYQR